MGSRNSTQSSHPSTPRSQSPADGSSKGVSKGEQGIMPVKQDHWQRLVTINVLPDEILGKIFKFSLGDLNERQHRWRTLVHVCRSWRRTVFASPRGLDLRFVYEGISSTEILDVWPDARIEIRLCANLRYERLRIKNLVAVLNSKYRNRVCGIVCSGPWEAIIPEMQKPFPELESLMLLGYGKPARVLPDSFLGGSAPRLRSFVLIRVSFPAMERLLLSARGLVILSLCNCPDYGSISPPAALATCLSQMISLEHLNLSFKSCPSHEQRDPLPLTRFVLPALTTFSFCGVGDYLEDLVARIDCPLLYNCSVEFLNDQYVIVPELHQFIGRAKKLMALDTASVVICNYTAVTKSGSWAENVNYSTRVHLKTPCSESDQQPAALANLCSSPSPYLSSVKRLEVIDCAYPSERKRPMDNVRWLKILAPFTAVKKLYLYNLNEVVPLVMHALQGASVTEVFPALRTIIVSQLNNPRPIGEAIAGFVNMRRSFGHPVDVYEKDEDSDVSDGSLYQ